MSSEETHEIRQLPHIDLQSPDFLCIFRYRILVKFQVMPEFEKVFVIERQRVLRCLMLLVKAIRVRVRNPQKVSCTRPG